MVKTAGQDDKLAFLSTPLYDTTMKRRDLVLEQNQSKTTIEVFMALYNKNIPENLPRVTIKTPREFQAQNPSLFKHGNAWSIERHRKKVMDWLYS